MATAIECHDQFAARLWKVRGSRVHRMLFFDGFAALVAGRDVRRLVLIIRVCCSPESLFACHGVGKPVVRSLSRHFKSAGSGAPFRPRRLYGVSAQRSHAEPLSVV